MAYSKYYQDKLSQYKTSLLSKLFINQNLQLQIPVCSDDENPSPHYNPIYSHYVNSSSSLLPKIKEIELCRIMAEADLSYKIWKQTQKKLNEAIETYRSSACPHVNKKNE